MDPDARADRGGDDHRLLLHVWTAAPGLGCLLHPGLEVADPGCVSALLCLLPLLVVRCLKRSSSSSGTLLLTLFIPQWENLERITLAFINCRGPKLSLLEGPLNRHLLQVVP